MSSLERVTSGFSRLAVSSSSAAAPSAFRSVRKNDDGDRKHDGGTSHSSTMVISSSTVVVPSVSVISSAPPYSVPLDEEERSKIEWFLRDHKVSELSQKQLSQLSGAEKLSIGGYRQNSLSEILAYAPRVQDLSAWVKDDVNDEVAISGLPNLRRLYVNKITDRGLAALRNLKLESITLASGRFTGEGFKSWGPTSPAKEIELFSYGNKDFWRFNLATLGQLQGLKKLFIAEAEITGHEFKGWSESQVETLHLRGCKNFNDVGLDLLADYLPNLKELILHDMDSITGSGFERWYWKSKVEKIKFERCKGFDETHLELLADIPTLKEVTFEWMGITGEGFKNWRKSKAQKIHIALCANFNDKGLGFIGAVPYLDEVDLRSLSSITGKGFEKWDQSPVQKINFYGVGLDDIGLSHLGRLQQLQEVIFCISDKFTGIGFGTWAESPVQKVDICNCQMLNDAGLSCLGKLPNLQDVILTVANITGEGFKTWAESPVQKMNLWSCKQLNDDGLYHLGRLQQLRDIILDHTKITGTGFSDWSKSPVQRISLKGSERVNDNGVALLAPLPRLREVILDCRKVTEQGFTTWVGRSNVKKLILPRYVPSYYSKTREALIKALGKSLPNIEIEIEGDLNSQL